MRTAERRTRPHSREIYDVRLSGRYPLPETPPTGRHTFHTEILAHPDGVEPSLRARSVPSCPSAVGEREWTVGPDRCDLGQIVGVAVEPNLAHRRGRGSPGPNNTSSPGSPLRSGCPVCQ